MKKIEIRSKQPLYFDAHEFDALVSQLAIQAAIDASLNVAYQIGREHSEYIHERMSAGVNIAEILKNVGRFSRTRTRTELFSSSDHGFAAAARIASKEIRLANAEMPIYDVRSFIGRSGDRSSLHFDWNLCPNLLVNIEGEKTIELIDPIRSYELGGYCNFTRVENSQVDHHIGLRPMQAVLIPPFWWHRASYLTNAWSLSFRFPADARNYFVMRHFYPSWKLIQFLIEADQSYVGELLKHPVSVLANDDSSINGENAAKAAYENVECILDSFLKRRFDTDITEHPFYRQYCIGHIEHYFAPRG